jgi:hypothetical protein
MSGVMGKAQVSANTTTLADGDSIAAYLVDSAGTLLTSTTVGSDEALDVNIVQTVGVYAEDSAHTSTDNGYFMLAIRNDAGGTLSSADGDYEGLQLNATGLLRTEAAFANDFTYLEDSGHTTGDRGAFMMGVRNDANAALTSTDLDYSPIATDSAGRIKSADSQNEDSAHTSGDSGSFVLGVRADSAGASLAGTDGDYSMIQTWSNGEVKSVDIVNEANLQQVVSVGTTAAQLPAANLARRKTLFIQNLENPSVYIGSSTVTVAGATRGLLLNKGAFITIDAGPDNDIYGIVASGTNDVAVWEHA